MILRSRAVRWAVYAVAVGGLLALTLAAFSEYGADGLEGVASGNGSSAAAPRISRGAIRSEPRPREVDPTPVGQLVTASRQADTASVRKLLATGVDVNASDRNGALPLHQAAGAGDIHVVDALLAAGADPQAADGIGWFALSHAAFAGSPEMTARLLEAGASPRASLSAESPLLPVIAGSVAARGGIAGATDATDERRAEVLRMLLNAGASTAGINDILFQAVVVIRSEAIVSVLLEHGARLDLASEIARALLNLDDPIGERLREAHATSDSAVP